MRYRIKRKYLNSPDLVIYSGAAAGTTLSSVKRDFELPRIALPLDRIEIVATIVTGTTAGSVVKFLPAGLIESIRSIKLTRTMADGSTNLTHSLSGPALFEWMVNTQLGSVDDGTKTCYQLGGSYNSNAGAGGSAGVLPAASTTYTFKLILPCANPQFADGPAIPLRTFSCADVHNDSQPPVLTIETEASDTFAATATTKATYASFTLAICCHYADISPEVNKFIMDRGGYLSNDLIETTKKTFVSTGPDFIKLPSPGSASAVMLRCWTNNSTVSGNAARGLPSAAGDVWQLCYAEDPVDEFKLADQQRLALESLGDPAWSMPGVYFFDYLTNAIGQDPSADLGSVRPLPAGIDTKIVGNIVATNNVDIRAVVQRYFGNLSPSRFAKAGA